MVSSATQFVEGATRAGRPRIRVHRQSEWQREFYEDTRRHKLIRAANRVGKTVGMAHEGAARMVGWHPSSRHRPPLQALVMGPTLGQMDSSGLLPWLWRFLEGDPLTGDPGPWIDPRLRYEPGSGIRGVKEPVIRLTGGPGKGGIIQVCSYDQGTKRLGGYKSHLTILDEPPPESRWSEVRARSLDVGGVIIVGFTPTPTSPDLTYLRKIVEQQGTTWAHHNVHLTPEATWVEGDPWPRLHQQRIDEFARDLLGYERRMRLEGWWEAAVEGRILDHFDREKHVRDFSLADIPAGALLAVGIDHGLVGNKQRAVLAAYSQERTVNPRAWYINERAVEAQTTTRDDARGILRMLSEVGLSYDDVDVWVGDRSVRGKATVATNKSNAQLRRALAHELQRDVDRLKPISIPYKYDGSVFDGARLINGMLGSTTADGTPRALVHTRCKELATAMERWDGDSKSPHKDVLDAARYPTERVCRVERNVGGVLAVTQRR